MRRLRMEKAGEEEADAYELGLLGDMREVGTTSG